MEIGRRTFLKVTGSTAVSTLLLGGLGIDLAAKTLKGKKPFKLQYAKERTSICPFCGVGCGLIVAARDGKVINTEGDPDHPINRGSLCSKGQSLFQIANSDRRQTSILYRAPNSDKWEEKSWDWTLDRIARNLKKTRDENWETRDAKGNLVNRTLAIAALGGAALDNEECYLYSKFLRGLGVTYMEHQARLCHSSTVAGLAESFGRGAMTNHWIDIGNSDCILVIGSNAAVNHPMSFKWITVAKEKGAKLICCDPRYTRTATLSDLYVPLRSGTDVALIGAMIKYCLDHDLYDREYLVDNTNASFLLSGDYKFEDGLFSGYDPDQRKYDKGKWKYQLDGKGIPKRDKTLTDPACVFKQLAKHYARYTTQTVSAITGTPQKKLEELAALFGATGRKDRAGTILYAMGTTQHTNGSQMIRSYAILQLLLGNIGVAGGGINAMRGESNVQGSTDMALLYHILPGYLKAPLAEDQSLAAYFERNTPVSQDPTSINFWKNTPKFTVSLLKAFYGDEAAIENGFCYDYLPKVSGNYSHMALFEAMYKGTVKGLLCMGQNPAVGGPNVRMERKALEKLDWLVVADLWPTETANFWKGPEAKPASIRTEVFLLPAAASFEKEGSVSNSGRWVQWRYKSAEPPGDARDDLWILNGIMSRVRALYRNVGGSFPDPVLKLDWNYGTTPDAHHVAMELNGYDLSTSKLLEDFTKLKDDGSTSSGCWIYSGCYNEKGNQMARRGAKDASGIGLYSDWSWCWPLNRRILYNRASCDAAGLPRDPKRAVLKWDGAAWTGDVPDFPRTLGPDKGMGAFLMTAEGRARLFGAGMADGPFPEHYEPWESPVRNLLSKVQNDPTILIWKEMNPHGSAEKFPIVATTFRLSEHWQAGAMTRNLPWLAELMPDVFCQVSKSLAAQKHIANGDKVRITSARGAMTAYALVTDRLRPFDLNGKLVEEIGIVWHYGYVGLATGDSANLLTPHIGDANTTIPEYKAFLVNLEKV